MIILNNITQGIDAEYGRFLEKISDLIIASTSHDMRTPLNTVINMHTLLEN
jgi:K+-sensing histidine kinase KdpD